MVLAWGIKTVVVKPNHNSDPVQISAPASDPEELHRQAKAIGIEAGNLAAGYDYQGAIALIQSFQNYVDYDFLMSKISDYTLLDSQLISYPHVDQVTHIFFHSLIVDNSRAFDGDNREAGYNQYMTTIAEFKAILQSMYDKGYVLVSPYDVAYEVTDANGNSSFRYGDIRLPSGKTPFLMSQDDVNYYGYMIGNADGKNEIPIFPRRKATDLPAGSSSVTTVTPPVNTWMPTETSPPETMIWYLSWSISFKTTRTSPITAPVPFLVSPGTKVSSATAPSPLMRVPWARRHTIRKLPMQKPSPNV